MIDLGRAVGDGAPVGLAPKTLNRHGQIAGATGTGKTETMHYAGPRAPFGDLLAAAV